MHRRFLPLAGAILFALAPSVDALAVPLGTFEYRIDRNGSPIGRERVTVAQQDDRTVVSSVLHVQVKMAFVTVYRYDQTRSETWRDQRLTVLETRVNDNGDKLFLKGRAEANDFAIETEKGRSTAPLGLVPTGYWNIATVSQTRLLDASDGHVLNITVSGGANGSVDLGSRQVDARRYQITGDTEKELWYDGSDVLVKVRFKERDGSLIEFVLQ